MSKRLMEDLAAFIVQSPEIHRTGLAIATGNGEQRFWPFPDEACDPDELAGFLLSNVQDVKELEPQAIMLVVPVEPGAMERTPLSPLQVEDGPVNPVGADPEYDSRFDLLLVGLSPRGYCEMVAEIDDGSPLDVYQLADGHRHYLIQLALAFSSELMVMHMLQSLVGGFELCIRDRKLEEQFALPCAG